MVLHTNDMMLEELQKNNTDYIQTTVAVYSFICKYWIILAVNTPESLLCCRTHAKFSENHMHSLMNLVSILEDEDMFCAP